MRPDLYTEGDDSLVDDASSKQAIQPSVITAEVKGRGQCSENT